MDAVLRAAAIHVVLGKDCSLTHAVVVIVTRVGIDILLRHVKSKWSRVEKLLDGTPVILVDDGRVLGERLRRTRVDEADILSAARAKHGLERLDDVRYAVLETNGDISIVPKRGRSP